MSNVLPDVHELRQQIMVTSELVWSNRLSMAGINRWLENFTGEALDTDRERQLMLWLLANFVFYNDAEVRQLCRVLFRDYLHRYLLNDGAHGTLDVSERIDKCLVSTQFYHIGRPGESGAYVLYYFRQENDLPVSSFISNPSKLSPELETIVFVDDVTLTGSQAEKYLDTVIRDYFQSKRNVVITFLATQSAIDRLKGHSIDVISACVLDDRNKAFSSESAAFHSFASAMPEAKLVAEHYGRKLSPWPLGYGDGQYLFGFFYNTPDNTLPVFWEETGGWYPITRRYSKKYGGRFHDGLGTFV